MSICSLLVLFHTAHSAVTRSTNARDFSQIRWVESRVPDFTDGELDPTLYVSPRRQHEPDSGCVEFFCRFDVDNNGYYDLACSDDSGPELKLYLGSDSGYFPRNCLRYGVASGGNVELADLNLDGNAELIHSGWREGRLTIYWGTPAGPDPNNRTTLSYVGEGEDVCVYDMDKDSYLDILIGTSYGYVHIFWGSPTGYSQSNRLEIAAGVALGHNMEVADFDRDGWADIVCSDWSYNHNPVIYWDVGRNYREIVYLPYRYNNAHGNSVADLNKDGWLDLVFSGYDTVATSYIYWGSAQGFTSGNKTVVQAGQCYGGTAVVDWNDDTWLDIVYLRGNWMNGGMWPPKVFYNTRSAPWYANTDTATLGNKAFNGSGGFVADFNFDDHLDIFINNMVVRDTSYILWGPGYTSRTALPADFDHHGVFREPGNFYDRGYYAYYHSSVIGVTGDSAITSGTVSWTGDLPPQTYIFMAVRSGPTPRPDSNWTRFHAVNSSGGPVPDSVLGNRYFQYRAKLVYSRPCWLPTLEKVECVLNVAARRDVGVQALLAPCGIVSEGSVIQPRAVVRNYSSQAETLNVVMRIGTGYTRTLGCILPPGGSDTVVFVSWLASPQGNYPVKCSTILAADVNPVNDFKLDSVTVVLTPGDAAAEAILAPLGTLDSGAVVTPIARVRNLCNRAISLPVRLTITGGYDRTAYKVLSAMAADTVHFPAWTAAPVGNLAIRCSTALNPDTNRINDTVSARVTVRARLDAATIQIIAPVGELDSGTSVRPVVRIANLGFRTAAIPVNLSIGPAYSDSRTKTLNPGTSDTAGFALYPANTVGRFTVKCSTALAADIDPANDRMIDSIRVIQGLDAAAIAILEPSGSVDSGTSVVPVVRIANLSAQAVLIPVNLRIGSGYARSRNKSLAAGASDTVHFPTWTAFERGYNAVFCSTALAGDRNPANDTVSGSVLVRSIVDAGVVAILAPFGTVDSGAALTPRVLVGNFGAGPALVPARLTIGAFYAEFLARNLLPGAIDTFVFPSLVARVIGTHLVRCSLSLAGDLNPSNDTASEQLTVRPDIDAAAISIIAPAGNLDSGAVVVPVVSIANLGSRSELVPVQLHIGSAYFETRVKPLTAGATDTVTFPAWTAQAVGPTIIRCSTALDQDRNPANNLVIGLVTVGYRLDAAALRILSPTGRVDSGATVTPRAVIANYGQRPADIPARMTVGTGYAQTVVRSLEPGAQDTVSFPDWRAVVTGQHPVCCSTALAADAEPGNNAVRDSVFVGFNYDVGTVQVLAPAGTIDSGTVIQPRAIVRNFGSAGVSCPVVFRISDGYAESLQVSLPLGSVDTLAFPAWTAAQLGGFTASCSTCLAGDEQPANDRAQRSGLVRVRIDAAAVAILRPVGTIDSGTVVIPVARIRNLGTRYEDIPAFMRIGADYLDLRTLRLAPGAQDTVCFAPWSAGSQGTVPAFEGLSRLSLRKPGLSPMATGSVPSLLNKSGVSMAGAASRPRLGISGRGEDVAPASPSAFDNPVVFPVGCSVALAGDEDPANDTVRATVNVVTHRDAAVLAILSPPAEVDSGATVTPRAVIVSYSTGPAQVPVRLRIGSGYEQSLVRTLAPQVPDTVIFPDWTAHASGVLAVQCTVGLDGDENDSNNQQNAICEIIVHDVGAAAITMPRSRISSGDTIIPQALVTNFGTRAETFVARMTMSDGYLSDRPVTGLPPGQTRPVDFDPKFLQPGLYLVTCSTRLAADMNSANDRIDLLVNAGPRRLDLEPDSTCSADPNTIVEYRLSLTNQSFDADTIDLLAAGINAGWRLELTDTLRRPLADNNGNFIPDVGLVQSDETVWLLARVFVPPNEPAGAVQRLRVHARSGADTLVADSVNLTALIRFAARIVIAPSQRGRTDPGVEISYLLYVVNQGNAQDFADIQLVNRHAGWNYRMTDVFGNALTDMNSNGMPDVGPVAAFGGETRFQLHVTPAADAWVGDADTVILQAWSGNLQSPQSAAEITTEVNAVIRALVVDPDQQDAMHPDEDRYYTLFARFEGNADDVIEVSARVDRSEWHVALVEPDVHSPLPDADNDRSQDLGLLLPGADRQFQLRVRAPHRGNLSGNLDSLGPVRVTVTGTSSRNPLVFDSAVVTLTLVPALEVHAIPNPASEGTSFIFGIPSDGSVGLKVYDRHGVLLREFPAEARRAVDVPQYFVWNPITNQSGRELAPGTYYYILEYEHDGIREFVRKKLVKK